MRLTDADNTFPASSIPDLEPSLAADVKKVATAADIVFDSVTPTYAATAAVAFVSATTAFTAFDVLIFAIC
jgi:hypothetical protein